MTALVLQLQSDSLDRAVPVSDLLRKSLVAAKKLNLPELEAWVQLELDGYGANDEVPKYRHVAGRLEALNPYHGWQPIMWDEPEMAESASSRAWGNSISEIESVLSTSKSGSSQFQMTLPATLENQLWVAIGQKTQVTFMTTGAALQGITDAVRNIVLKWALQLEADGILGEELAFSEKEKATAEKASYHIQNFFAGDIQGSQFQQQSPNAVQVGEFMNLDHAQIGNFLRSLENVLDDLNLPKPDEKQVLVDIKTVDTQLGAPEPKKAIIKESLISLRRVLEGAGGATYSNLQDHEAF